MTKTQVEYLMLLGYEGTQEDGAILQHKRLHDMARFVWRDETFREVLSMYPARLDYAVRRDASRIILGE